jgi:hypothetical protein
MDPLMERWTARNATDTIMQIPDTQTFIFKKFFTKEKGHKANKIDVPIKKGRSIVLKSISPDADHQVHDRGDAFLMEIKLPRFALSNPILASELNDLKVFSSGEDQTISLAKQIGEIMQEHKSSYLTTIEYMAAGAMFGKVIDGDGKILFEFDSTREPVTFGSVGTLTADTTDPIGPMRDIDQKIADEFGTDKSYVGLASREFMDKLWTVCLVYGMDKKGQAAWETLEGKRCLVVHGTTIYPYSVKYKNAQGQEKPFIPTGEAVFVPESSDAFEVHYGRADHIEAVDKAPSMFFATTEQLRQGKGHEVLTETKTIPVCVRPAAIIKAKFD